MKKLGVFILTIMMVIALFPQNVFAAESTSFDQDMTKYLEEVSSIRGFEVTKDDINQSLTQYDMTMSDFTSVEELKSFLADVIKADLSNLSGIYDYYELDQSTLTDVLSEYGEEINDYVYLDDLDSALALYTYDSSDDQGTELGAGFDLATVMGMLGELGITDSEIQKLQEYYTSMEDYLSSSEVEKKLESLSTRMMTWGQTMIEKGTADENYQPSDEEINEFVSIYDEVLSIMKLKAVFYLSQDGSYTPISFQELLEMEDMEDADVKVELFTSDSELLADMVIKGEPGKSGLGEIIDEVSQTDSNNGTVKGGTLPKTASDDLSNALLGLLIAAAGIVVYRKVRNDRIEISEKQA